MATYAEPPTWTEDKNGVIGIGRQISVEEIETADEFVFQREGLVKQKLESLTIPQVFSSGHKLAFVDDYGLLTKHAEYMISEHDDFRIVLDYEFCNCTKTMAEFEEERITNHSYSQMLQLDGIPILAHPKKVNYLNDIHYSYGFLFYYDGYKISLHTNHSLEDGMTIVELLESIKNN